MTLSWVFFSLCLVGLAFTLNALRPPKLAPLGIGAFFAGWVTSELPLFHIWWQAIATLIFIRNGALDHWPGVAGLAATGLSWIGLAVLEVSSRSSWKHIAAGLEPLGLSLAKPPIPFAESRIPVPRRGRDVEVIKNIDYWGDDIPPHRLDIFRSAESSRKHNDPGQTEASPGLPVLFYIHGGAWILGDKREQGLPMMFHLARNGFICVSANYRLSPRATWPDLIVDCKRALVWLKENIAEYGGDPTRIIVSGGSAGGHLAALVALSEGDPDFQPGFEDADTSVIGCLPFYGVYDFTNEDRVFAPGFVKFVEKTVFKEKFAINPNIFANASPYKRIHENAPPFLVVAGRNDTLVPIKEARRFVEKLRATSSNQVLYVELPFAQHAFEIFPSVRSTYCGRGVELFLNAVASGSLPMAASSESRKSADRTVTTSSEQQEV
ncbi:MAG TPA: alpha/beta hydrolase [Acidimicrobiales bacterium]|nr:alpha/beta hydrolase [Acidimicrobiales bacterium]